MRARDFTNAPPAAQSGACFVGATRYRGPLSMFHAMRAWPRLIRRLKASPGYCWHTFYFEFPFTLGTIALFDTEDDMIAFGRTEEHRRLMIWATRGTKRATGGFIRVYSADAHGYTNGAWRTEDSDVRAIPTFTPLDDETDAPRTEREP